MSAPKGPPKARHLLVPPLTSKTENGELYKRRADVEDSIAQVLAQPPSEWVAIATAKGEHRLADEALVFLIRAAGSGLPDVIGGLVNELCRRLIRTAKRLAQGFNVSTTEAIINSVEIEVIELVLTKPPSRQSEFLEIAFKTAVEHRTINAVEKFQHDPMSSIIETIQSSEDDREPIDIVENLADAADGPEKLLLSREAETLKPELLRTAYEAVKDHRHRKAVILHLAYGWPITSIAAGMTVGDTASSKHLDAHRGDGTGRICFDVAATFQCECEGIAQTLCSAVRDGGRYSDHAILARSHTTLARIAKHLERCGIPCLYFGDFFERPEIRDLLSVLSVVSERAGIGLFRVARAATLQCRSGRHSYGRPMEN